MKPNRFRPGWLHCTMTYLLLRPAIPAGTLMRLNPRLLVPASVPLRETPQPSTPR